MFVEPIRDNATTGQGKRSAPAAVVHSCNGDDRHYSPPQVIDCYSSVVTGAPVQERICTSHVERANKTMRMQIRRLTRLTDGHSKKWQNHEAALALFFAYYNFCRVHSTIKTTPAVASGLASEPWSLEKLLHRATVAAYNGGNGTAD